MLVSTGYTLDQLLTWCRQDELIEYFEQEDEVVIIIHGGQRYAFRPEEALVFLKNLFTSGSDRSTSSLNGLDGLGRRVDKGGAA